MPALVLDLAQSPVRPVVRQGRATPLPTARETVAREGAKAAQDRPAGEGSQSADASRRDPGELPASEILKLRLQAIRYEAEDILAFDLVDPEGRRLPPFAPGAHLDLHLDGGIIRQYSLCGDPADRSRYCIAVLKEKAGRGGSKAVHETLRCGQEITVSAPRNHFPLAEEASHHVLLAGGIGVTPLLAMVTALEAKGASYELHYCTRNPARTAFLERLRPLVEKGSVHLHHDEGDPGRGLDIAGLLKERREGAHLYYCGPAGFMEAVKDAAAGWPEEAVHFEYFAAPAGGVEGDKAADGPFLVRLALSGEEFEVPADKTIVDVLRENDVHVDTSCREGYCGTCLTRYTEGEPDHRDTVLDKKDRQEFMMICCSRAKSPLLVLDL